MDKNPASNPGYKTTEFWLSVLAALVTAIYASGAFDGFTEDHIAMKILSGVATVLIALGYTVSRTLVKKDAAKAPATPQVIDRQAISDAIENSVAIGEAKQIRQQYLAAREQDLAVCEQDQKKENPRA